MQAVQWAREGESQKREGLIIIRVEEEGGGLEPAGGE